MRDVPLLPRPIDHSSLYSRLTIVLRHSASVSSTALDSPSQHPGTSRRTMGSRDSCPPSLVHTPIDDLESFIWVLYYTLLEFSPDLNATDTDRWNHLNSDYLVAILSAKLAIRERWTSLKEGNKPAKLPIYIRPFYNLLTAWFETARVSIVKLQNLLDDDDDENERLSLSRLTTLSKETYKRYIQEGLEHIPSLPEDFPEPQTSTTSTSTAAGPAMKPLQPKMKNLRPKS
ncbi:hypothetical protein HGRIS_008753 [Hohenbuehelia grisea]|uniref:Fungal-type protein kinase domain-containing protein n=1 Tax=Hohenbuehelia grisea TaxID=104357 RepID=A0ABR3J9G8_9AGAR